jgi:hypothetical protein
MISNPEESVRVPPKFRLPTCRTIRAIEYWRGNDLASTASHVQASRVLNTRLHEAGSRRLHAVGTDDEVG